jgi:NitT/TauT family transport system permease protein
MGHKGTISPWWGVAIPVVAIIIWEICAVVINNSFILPRLGEILPVLAHPFNDLMGCGSLAENAVISLKRVLTGFFLAVAVAVPVGVLMGRYQPAWALFNPFFQLLRPVPPLAWMPLAIAWFQIGGGSMIFIIFLGAFFPLLLATIDGVRGVRNTWCEVAESLGATKVETFATVVLPGALPVIWNGCRISFGIAWMCVVAAEMMPGVTAGLGFLIMYAYNMGQIQIIVAGMVVIGIIGLGVDFVFRAVDTRYLSWRALER